MQEVVTLSNGLRVIMEYLPAFPSVNIGLWVGAGSMYETPEENGFSHFIEHMLFKSTPTRSTRRIAVEMDALGGQINAYTAKECTCYYAKVIDEHLSRAMELLCDMFLNACMEESEFEKERGVILEEIAMSEDTPEDLVFDLLSEAYFGKHPLAMPILGTEKQIAGLSRSALLAYKARHYRPDNTVLAVTGCFDRGELLDLAERLLGGWKAEGSGSVPAPVDMGCRNKIVREKDIEQVHLCLAYPGVPQNDDEMYALSVVNGLFGGGMSSRLFQKIREEMGAVYSVYSYPTGYVNCGSFSVYAGTSPETAQEVADALHREIRLLCSDGFSREEFDMAKEQLRVSFKLSLESGQSRMSALGRNLLLFNEVETPGDVFRKIEAVTPDDARAMIGKVFGRGCGAAAAVGRSVRKLQLGV